MIILFFLLAAHALCDFPLQGDATAINKNRNANTALQKSVPWQYWLLSHALIHGGAVALITQNVWLGIAETIAHFWIDFFKCEGKYNIHVDQILHVACKVVWFILYIMISVQ